MSTQVPSQSAPPQPSESFPPAPTTFSPSQPQPQPQPQLPPNQVSPTQRTAEARTAFTASLHSAAANLDSDLQSRAKNIHANAKALQKQERDVEKEIKGLRKCNEQMEVVVGAWKGEWGREMGRLGVVKKKMDRGGDEDGEGEFGEFDLGGIERELGMLEDWVRIVEEEREGQGQGQDGGEAAVVDRGDGRGNARQNKKNEEQGEREVESRDPAGVQ